MEDDTCLQPLLFEIGVKLREIRHTRKEKLEAVGHATGIGHGVISRIENGKYKGLTLAMLTKLARYYNVTVPQLVIQ